MKALIVLILLAFAFLGLVSAYWVLKPMTIGLFVIVAIVSAYLLGRFHQKVADAESARALR